MSLYPSFEGLTIGKEVNAQNKLARSMMDNGPLRANYNQLASEFLGMDLTNLTFDEYGNPNYTGSADQSAALVVAPGSGVAIPTAMVPRDPIEATNQVREIKVSKDKHGKVGLQLRDKDNGVFITYVEADSPAAHAGFRFGDQVLQINNTLTAAYSGSKAMNLIRDGPSANITIIIRDRPLDRVLTLTKDSQGNVGIVVENGKINKIVKDSSAARNGVLTSHQLLEINGVNVIGLTDKKIREHLSCLGNTIRITITPSFFFEHIAKKLGRTYMKQMDRSIPIA